MANGVFNQWLQDHGGHHHVQRGRVDFLDHPKLVAPETHDLNVQVIGDEVEFLPQGRKVGLRLEPPPQDVGEFHQHLACGAWVQPDQRRDGIERVEEKMRVDLADQAVHAGLDEAPFLLFQFPLNAGVVPDAQRKRHGDSRGKKDQDFRPQTRRIQEEEVAVGNPSDLDPRQFQGDANQKEQDLPVHGRLLEPLLDGAIKTEVNKRGEFPDLLLVGTEPAGRAGHHRVENSHRNGQEFKPGWKDSRRKGIHDMGDEDRRQADHHAHHEPHHGPAQQAPNHSDLKAQVGALIAGHQAREDAQHERHAKKCREKKLLFGSTDFNQQQAAKLVKPGDDAGQ